jgi:uncharacterized protein (TIGR03086 family)
VRGVSDVAERYAKIADAFTERVRGVPADAWDNPAPCEGWVARDVVKHLVEWVPGFCQSFANVELRVGTAPDDDPVGAWEALDRAIREAMADADTTPFETPMGKMTFAESMGAFVNGDVLVHTWDIARATGQDETLDADEVHSLYAGMQSMDEALRTSGHFGPRVDVPDDADEQTKLIAFTGRTP